ncbi:glutathione transferase [Trifolium repens]|nr:glutathione transferase [Trifolium repens]
MSFSLLKFEEFYISKKYYYRGTQHNCKTWQSWWYNATCTALVDKLIELDVEIGWDAKCIFEMDIEDIVEFADDDEKYYRQEPNKTVIETNMEKLNIVLDVYEAKRSTTKYLAGDFYSLADLSHISEAHYFMQTPCASMINERIHVKAWWEDISSRPAFQKVVGGMSFGQNDQSDYFVRLNCII